MRKGDIREAGPIVERAMGALLLTVSQRGRPGSDVRTEIGDLLAQLDVLLRGDAIGAPLDNCFSLAQ